MYCGINADDKAAPLYFTAFYSLLSKRTVRKCLMEVS
jgi:hypothetical protein